MSDIVTSSVEVPIKTRDSIPSERNTQNHFLGQFQLNGQFLLCVEFEESISGKNQGNFIEKK